MTPEQQLVQLITLKEDLDAKYDALEAAQATVHLARDSYIARVLEYEQNILSGITLPFTSNGYVVTKIPVGSERHETYRLVLDKVEDVSV